MVSRDSAGTRRQTAESLRILKFGFRPPVRGSFEHFLRVTLRGVSSIVPFMHRNEKGRRRALLLGVLVEGGLGAGACLVGWLIGTLPWKQLSWNAGDVGLGIVAVLPLLVLFAIATRSQAASFVHIRRFLDDVFLPLFAHSTLAELALLSALAGLGEELFFRGLLQTALGESLGHGAGLFVAGVCFGAAHWITPAYALFAGAIGVYFGWLALATGNLAVPVVAHGLYDFLALVYLLRWHTPDLSSDESSERLTD